MTLYDFRLDTSEEDLSRTSRIQARRLFFQEHSMIMTRLTTWHAASRSTPLYVEHRWYIEYGGHGHEPILTGIAPEFTFHLVGEYLVTLAVTDAAGNTAEDTLVVTVKSAPHPPGPDGEGGLSMALIGGIVAAVVMAVLVAVLLMRRRPEAQ